MGRYKMIPQPDMDVPPPSSAERDAFREPPLARYSKDLPEEDRRAAQLHLSYLDEQAMQGTEAFYNLKTEDFAVYDPVTGRTEHGKFKSNTEGKKNWNEPIAKGDYAILQRGEKIGFRLEAYDKQFGDDAVAGTGGLFLPEQTRLRLHEPGDSIGCVTARDWREWNRVESLIRGGAKSEVSVETKWGEKRIRREVGPLERVTFYGTLHVF